MSIHSWDLQWPHWYIASSVLCFLFSSSVDDFVSIAHCLLFFNWSIVALHCCVSFCYMAKWISHMCTYIQTDAEAEAPMLCPPDAESRLTGKDSDAGRDWGQEEKGTPEDEMAGWHHQLDGHEFEWTPGVGNGLRGLACCISWGRKESDTTERLNWTELNCNKMNFWWKSVTNQVQ